MANEGRVTISRDIFRHEERMAKQAALRAVDLEPIDRLEEKITLLVAMVNRLRAEQAKAADDNAQLTQEIDVLRARLADSEGVTSEIAALRGERELIRTRVSDMLDQLEHLNL
jgi:regulator of replication initiation timing